MSSTASFQVLPPAELAQGLKAPPSWLPEESGDDQAPLAPALQQDVAGEFGPRPVEDAARSVGYLIERNTVGVDVDDEEDLLHRVRDVLKVRHDDLVIPVALAREVVAAVLQAELLHVAEEDSSEALGFLREADCRDVQVYVLAHRGGDVPAEAGADLTQLGRARQVHDR
eukprot:CAMPEP_0204551330 /NCGR_PEP_ID=MMETSP0661-20131031/25803_1 /ASSEMBLY_ACC=CAM_ASM_000606 /TAXON_ID=109239 /ORGANISM="Alexandrium margalefi, Strain AMGDE01CS-322" /LENGTH=169 /DNA_ID=CAMNT_0051558325 /DNA_START=154 /DNA_END=658 /DNA_ORIENTATION=-